MDSTIISAIIAAVAAIVAALIGVSNKGNPNKEKKRIAFLIVWFLVFLAVILVIYTVTLKEATAPVASPMPTVEVSKYPNPPQAAAPVATPTPTTAATKYPNPPDDSLLDLYGPTLHYPDRTEYLDECRTMYIKAPKGYSVYAYSSHRTDRRQIDEIRDGEEVTVLAENKNNGLSCVIVESTQRAVWVTSTNLVTTPD